MHFGTVAPRPFLAILEYCKQSKSEAREGLVYSVQFQPSLLLTPCFSIFRWPGSRDYTVCHFLRLLQSFQSLATSSCSWSICTSIAKQIKTWTDKDTVLAQMQRFVLHGWLLIMVAILIYLYITELYSMPFKILPCTCTVMALTGSTILIKSSLECTLARSPS